MENTDKHNIGIHIRLTDTLTDIIEKALRLGVPFFQTFFTFPTGKHIRPEQGDVKNFLKLRREYFKDIYLHGSYWVNLCSSDNISHTTLAREILMAKRLEFTHIVLHPGSASKCKSKSEGIEFLARALNRILKHEHDNEIKIVLENTAHGNLTVGSDIDEFYTLMTKLDKPEKISFCIDTAHAYSYGYNIADFDEQDKFISHVDHILGKEKIALIHLNDTYESLGLKIDKHNIPGEGNIGLDALKRFLNNPLLNNIPALIELPNLPEEEEKIILKNVNYWI